MLYHFRFPEIAWGGSIKETDPVDANCAFG
jgi:hypothetical protein